MYLCHRQPSPQRQQGAAALIVVMLLFFMISMVAAYTSRNLIFEQRTATNQYRSTQALEAADAGIEWALGQLNAGRITSACVPSTDDAAATSISFRERYLLIDSATGNLTYRPVSGGGSSQAQCVFDGSSGTAANWKWSCICPLVNATPPTLAVPAAGTAPAFIVRMRNPGGALFGRNDLMQLEANSCTRLGTDCLNFTTVLGGTGDGVAAVRAVVALRGALTRTPSGPLTLVGSLAALPGAALLDVRNDDTVTDGLTIHAGGTLPSPPTGLTLTGMPGTIPANTAITSDANLVPAARAGFTTEDRRFAAFFGMMPGTYRGQPGLPVIDCSGGCNASTINSAMLRNPGRALWLTGAGGTVTIDANVGTAALPALLIVEGDLAFSSGVTFTGMVYGRKAAWTWTTTGSATLRGAAVGEGNLALVGAGASTNLVYNPAVLKALRVSYGTFVRVPGGWKDF